MKYRLLSALLGAALLTSASSAQAQSLRIVPPDNGVPLEAGRAYLVRFACKIADGAEDHANFLNFLGIGGNSSAVHGFYIQKSRPMGAASGVFASSSDSLAAVHIYTHSKLDPDKNFDSPCDDEFLVSGNQTPYLMAFLSRSNKSNTDLLTGTAVFAAAAIPTLFSLVTGAPLPAVDGAKLESAKSLVDTWSTFLNVFNDDKAWSRAYRLRTGQYAIGTDISNAVVAVSREDHLLTGISPFKKGLSDILSTDPALTADDLSSDDGLTAKCTAIASAWASVGVRAPEDQAYVLYKELQKVNASKQQILTCFGGARARASITHLDLFDMPEELQFTVDDLPPESDLSATWGMQPRAWHDLETTIKLLVRRLGTKPNGVDSLLPETRKQIAALFAPEFSITDDTLDYSIVNAVSPGGDATISGEPLEVLSKLSGAGFQRFGCYLLTGGPAGSKFRSPENEVAVMLMWKGKVADPLAADTPAYIVRVYFDGRKIRNFTVTDELAPVDVAIAADCAAKDSFTAPPSTSAETYAVVNQ